MKIVNIPLIVNEALEVDDEHVRQSSEVAGHVSVGAMTLVTRH
jgi:hypothetical protein